MTGTPVLTRSTSRRQCIITSLCTQIDGEGEIAQIQLLSNIYMKQQVHGGKGG